MQTSSVATTSLSSTVEVRSPISVFLITSQTEFVKLSLSSASAYSKLTTSEAATFKTVTSSTVAGVYSLTSTQATAIPSHSFGISLSLILKVGSATSSTSTLVSVPTTSPSPTPSESSGDAISSRASSSTILETFSRVSSSSSMTVGSPSVVKSTSSYMSVTFSTTTITTPKPEILKTFRVTMTITNREYRIALEDKKSTEFKGLAEEIQNEVYKVLGGLEGFVNSTVEKFSETNSVRCQLSVIFNTSNITEGTIRERLGDKLGDLEIANVEFVDKFTTTTPTEKATTKKPIEGGNVFQVEMKISNQDYTDELSNSSSEEFKTLSKELTDILTKVFRPEVRGFSHVVIIEFRKGSVICIFQVIVTKESEVTADEIQETLSDAGDTGKYTFTDITVKEMTMKQTGQRLKWPDWAIIVTCLCGVMLLFIIVTIFLVR